MTSLKVKTTLTQLFLLSILTRLPEWKQDSSLRGGGMHVYCNSLYRQKLCCLRICTLLAIYLQRWLVILRYCVIISNSVEQSTSEKETQICFILFILKSVLFC